MLLQGSDFLLLVGEINLILIVEAGFIFLSNIGSKCCLDIFFLAEFFKKFFADFFFFFFFFFATVTEHPKQSCYGITFTLSKQMAQW